MKRIAFVATAMLTAFIAFPGMAWAAPPGDNGTIKVYPQLDPGPQCPVTSNDPKPSSPFYIGGFGFDSNQVGQLAIYSPVDGPKAEIVYGLDGEPVEVTTDANGDFCHGPISLGPGQYKVELVISDADGKQKVFKIEGEVVSPSVTFVDPACANSNTPAVNVVETEGIAYAVVGDVVPGGSVTVTASVTEGFAFAEGAQTVFEHTFTAAEVCSTPTPTPVPTPTPSGEVIAVDIEAEELAATGPSANTLGTLLIGLGLIGFGSTVLYLASKRV